MPRRRVRLAAVEDVPIGEALGEGDLEGRIVLCPWHAWRWDVTTGANANNPAVKMACFPVIVEDGAVFVELP